MIKGKQREDDVPEYDEDQLREEMYYHSLLEFEGVEGHHYGINDELFDLGKLIDTMGETIIREEKEFQAVEKVELQSEEGWPTERVLKVWHKKNYRQFTYRSMMLLIHTTFEDGMVNLYNILVMEERIADTVDRRKKIVDIIKVLQSLDPSITGLLDEIRGYNFIRNKVAHAGGYYEVPSTDVDAFNKLVRDGADIHVEELRKKKGRFTHRMQITRSTVLKDYLDVIRNVFAGLLKGAHKLDYLVPATTPTAPVTTEK
jgi:hypothetical protein